MAGLNDFLDPNAPVPQVPPVDPNIPMAQAGTQMATMGAQQPRAIPPVDEQDFAQRTSGWAQFLQGLRSDPNISQALLFMGARMLQPPRPGQTTGGVLGEAVLGGTQYYGALNQANADAQRQAEKDALDAQAKQTQIESAKATIEKTKQDTRLTAEEAPLKRRSEEALAKVREAEARVRAAQAAGLEAEDPAEMARLELALAKAKVRAEEALTNARNRSNQDTPPKDKPGKVTVHQTKGDDGRIYRTVRENGVETFEAITPAMSRMDAMAEAKAEWAAEHGTGWSAPSPTPEWLNERARFHMTPRVEQIGAGGPPAQPPAPAATGKPKKEVDRATLKATVEGRLGAAAGGAEVGFERQATPKAGEAPAWSRAGAAAPEASFAVKQKNVNRGVKYYVEGDPIPGNSYEFEADAKERARVLRARKGK